LVDRVNSHASLRVKEQAAQRFGFEDHTREVPEG